MQKQANKDDFRNEAITIMFSANEKAKFVRFCEKRGMAKSEFGRMALLEYMDNWEFGHEQELSSSKTNGTNMEYLTLLEAWFGRFIHERRLNKGLKQLCKENGIVIPTSLLTKFKNKNLRN